MLIIRGTYNILRAITADVLNLSTMCRARSPVLAALKTAGGSVVDRWQVEIAKMFSLRPVLGGVDRRTTVPLLTTPSTGMTAAAPHRTQVKVSRVKVKVMGRHQPGVYDPLTTDNSLSAAIAQDRSH